MDCVMRRSVKTRRLMMTEGSSIFGNDPVRGWAVYDSNRAANEVGRRVAIVHAEFGIGASKVPAHCLARDIKPLGNLPIVFTRCQATQDFDFTAREPGIVDDGDHGSKRFADEFP